MRREWSMRFHMKQKQIENEKIHGKKFNHHERSRKECEKKYQEKKHLENEREKGRKKWWQSSESEHQINPRLSAHDSADGSRTSPRPARPALTAHRGSSADRRDDATANNRWHTYYCPAAASSAFHSRNAYTWSDRAYHSALSCSAWIDPANPMHCNAARRRYHPPRSPEKLSSITCLFKFSIK